MLGGTENSFGNSQDQNTELSGRAASSVLASKIKAESGVDLPQPPNAGLSFISTNRYKYTGINILKEFLMYYSWFQALKRKPMLPIQLIMAMGFQSCKKP
jgi:hypothetical protein